MKLTAILLTAACLQVAARTNGQTVTISVKDAPLEQVFEQLKKQTGISFLWDEKTLKDAKPVTIDLKKATIEEVMNACVKDQPLTYSIIENLVLVKPTPTPALQSGDLTLSLSSPLTINIHGRIVNENGDPVAGATVQVKGTQRATATDADGKFVLNGVDENATLIFSGADIETQEVKLKGRKEVLVSAKIKITTGQEVIVNKGYYTEKQKLSVGNVSHVSGEDINKQPVSDPLHALEGRVPGLSISQSSGIPGAYSTVQLRGQNFLVGPNSSVTSNDPLYVIDGVPFNSESLSDPFYGAGILGNPKGFGKGIPRAGMSPFSVLNPADIESIDVLKDADATAIYGARGANGVILITTRKGKPGPVKIDLNYSEGASRITRRLDLLNTQQYLQMRREAFRNDGLRPDVYAIYGLTDYDVDGLWDTTRYTDWQKELVERPASFTNAQASVSGGNLYTQYVIGAGYSRQGTTFPGDYANQNTSVFISLTSATVNERFHVNFSAMYGNNNNNLPGDVGFIDALTLAPDAPSIYDAAGNINWEPIGGYATFGNNPMAFTLNHIKSISVNLNGNLQLRYRILKGLALSASFGYSKAQMDAQITFPGAAYAPPDNTPNNAIMRLSSGGRKGWTIEPQLTYHRSIGKGEINLLAGSTFQESSGSHFANRYAGFSSDAFITNPAAATDKIFGGYDVNQYKYNSIYGRLGYNWEEKYIVNLSGRRDGSSRFGPNKQFGNFGAAGIGWVFSKERVIERNLHWVSFGKLRASYGSVGSDGIGDYQFMRTYGFDAGTTYQGAVTLTPSGHANPYFQWQSVRKLEIGLELGLFNDKLNTSFSYYRNRTGNQLVGYPLPGFTGFGSVTENLHALIQNKGWEFTANTVNLKTSNFRWTTTFNISFPSNKVISFPGIEKTSYASKYSVGQSLFSERVFHYIGVDPQTGLYSFSSKGGDQPVSGKDQYWSKPITQQYFGGLGNSLTYKWFTLDIFFQIVKQRGTYVPGFDLPGQYAGHPNQPTIVLNRWQAAGDKTDIQLFTSGYNNSNAYDALGNFSSSDGAITDASFIRLKNVALSYSLPEKWQKKVHLKGLRIYAECQNLLTITKYPGWDPETGNGLVVPPFRTITGGIQITF